MQSKLALQSEYGQYMLSVSSWDVQSKSTLQRACSRVCFLYQVETSN